MFIFGKPSPLFELGDRRRSGRSAGLGRPLSGFGTSALQRATFTSSLFGLRAKDTGGHSHFCPNEEHKAQKCKFICPRSHRAVQAEPGPSLLSSCRFLSFSIPLSVNGTAVLPDSESQKRPLRLLPHCLSLPRSPGAWPFSASLLPPHFSIYFYFIQAILVFRKEPQRRTQTGMGLGFWFLCLSTVSSNIYNGDKMPTFLRWL